MANRYPQPTILGERLLAIGRQVHTPYGKIIDLLAIDADGNLHVLELKRDMTPRDVVAQALDYGSWVRWLQRADVQRSRRTTSAMSRSPPRSRTPSAKPFRTK
ncbi:MAG TPA: hypothetical protein VGK53_00510 [Propionicimonas sp.]